MTTKPSVSIITPIKAKSAQHVRWLDEAVASVQGQTRDDWEMVIVDDHSAVALPSYADSRVRVVSLTGGSGVSAARNEAARLARSDLLLPLDADDKLAPEAVEKFLGAWTGKGIVYSDVVKFGRDFARAYLSPGYNFDTLLRQTFMLVGCLHLKADWQRVGGWRDDMQGGLEDWEYWIALGELGVCGKRVSEPLYWYRQTGTGRLAKLKKDPLNWHKAYNRMRELHIDTYSGRKTKMCCGGKNVPGVVNKNVPAAKAPVVTGARDLLIYTGNRKGDFGLRGAVTGVRYAVPGRGDFVVEQQSGKPGVDKRDTARFLSMGTFRKATPPAPAKPPARAKPPTKAPIVTPEKSEAWEPAVMEPAAEPEKVEVTDPGTLSVRAIQALELTPDDAAQMLTAERTGRGRKSVIAHLERKAS